jgi:hypothetical protein
MNYARKQHADTQSRREDQRNSHQPAGNVPPEVTAAEGLHSSILRHVSENRIRPTEDDQIRRAGPSRIARTRFHREQRKTKSDSWPPRLLSVIFCECVGTFCALLAGLRCVRSMSPVARVIGTDRISRASRHPSQERQGGDNYDGGKRRRQGCPCLFLETAECTAQAVMINTNGQLAQRGHPPRGPIVMRVTPSAGITQRWVSSR